MGELIGAAPKASVEAEMKKQAYIVRLLNIKNTPSEVPRRYFYISDVGESIPLAG